MSDEKALKILNTLKKQYPNFEIILGKNSFEILIATMLSAQANDKQTIPAAKNLLRKYKKPQDLAKADLKDVEAIIRSVGLYKTKARRLITTARLIVDKHNGKVPETMQELMALPGVGRKTANIVVSKAFNKKEGIAVDTHVFRVSKRLGLSSGKTPAVVERDLMKLYPKSAWNIINELFIAHGRNTCRARDPRCESCILKSYCSFYKKEMKAKSSSISTNCI
ncbi:MAG: endonuclease III [Candidatus Diapherotrites archaeon]